MPETKLHFLDYWRIIRIRKAIIITVFLITAIIATAVTYILPVSYSSTSQIKIEPDTGSDIPSMNSMSSVSPAYDPYFLQTELDLLQIAVGQHDFFLRSRGALNDLPVRRRHE